MMHCIGEGGLENENAVQFLHTLYSLFDEHCVFWREIMSTFFGTIFTYTESFKNAVVNN